jgi:hypothetical protein
MLRLTLTPALSRKRETARAARFMRVENVLAGVTKISVSRSRETAARGAG